MTPLREPGFLEHAGVATRFLDKRHQLYDLKEEFVVQKQLYDRRCEELRQREEQLAKKDIAFQRSLVKYEALTKSNQLQQHRAKQRLEEEIRLCQEKDAEAEELMLKLEAARKEERRLGELVNSQKKYRDYLHHTALAGVLYLGPNNEISEILNRYDLLKDARDSSRQRLESRDVEIASQRDELDRLLRLKRDAELTYCERDGDCTVSD